jgi:adenosylcobinamide-GDP ribazoletransferase
LPPLLGRGAVVAWFLTTRYVRSQGLGEPLRGAPATGCRIAVLLSVIACLCFGKAGLLALVAAVITGWVWRRACVARLGGFTGDTAGALVELVEATTLVALVALHP